MNKFLKTAIIFIVAVVILGLSVFSYYFVGSVPVQEDIIWGVDFSQMQAESLGLNWEEVYWDIINDLGAKNIKLHTQWDWVEGRRDDYYFSDIDWQISQAEKYGVNIIYVVGMKSGRWPECHVPVWADGLTKQEQQEEILEYIKEVVLRYKDSKAITYWQVENEPFFRFGECPPWYYESADFLEQEVALVKSLDPSRQIIISDSGEGSMWFGAAKIGDIVGTTMYREAWARVSDRFGFYIRYLLSPVFYSRKALLIKEIFGKEVMVIELQAEPWASKPFYDVPIDEQEKTMNLQKFKDNVEYAKQTGFDKFYFWGVEWWHWMKTQKGKPEIWQEAKTLFGS